MKQTLTYKILNAHKVSEDLENNKMSIKIDQTLTQDATGTMAYLEFVSFGLDKVRTELSVSYVDHNTLQNGFMNADDHKFLQTVADKYGIVFSKAGNGICHQVNLERFAVPGRTILGSDSHTPTSSGVGALAIGAGGLDVACAMAGMPFTIVRPKVVGVKLLNKLRDGVSAKDIIIYLLGIMTVKGGVNKVIEYYGDGVKTLSVPERATICNMGAELGATSSVFPSDEITKEFLKIQKREQDFKPLSADEDCEYDENITIDLATLEPMASCPNSPDAAKPVSELKDIKVDQVLIGSCTNSSYYDFVKVASILKGKKIHKNVSLGIAPGSQQVLQMITKNGILDVLLEAGARILESACGPCIGMGQSPATNAVSLRTFNRNFYGRSGTNSAQVYLVSPEVAALSAVNGYISNPLGCKTLPEFRLDVDYPKCDSLLYWPEFKSEIVMGPNIKPLPKFKPIGKKFDAKVMISLEDNITTDHIMPAGAKVLPYRSNIEKISEFVFSNIDEGFSKRCLDNNGGVIVAKQNYGQGSSREHAAIAPRYLGIKAVIAASFARIHKKNLINFGILPIELDVKADLFDEIEVSYTRDKITVVNKTKNDTYEKMNDLTDEEYNLIEVGGLLNTF
ncbi:MAG: aconitate hydratase [Acholeplasmatales bacterium]|nr:aconitate hydratase [Acholeplasmatales bacterium]